MNTLIYLTQLLTRSPGNLAYHLIVLFAIGGALQAAWAQWQHAPYPQTRRLLQGLGVLFAARLVLFALGGLAWQEMLTAHLVLPVANRAVMALTLALFAWMWGFPENHRKGDRALWIALAVIALAIVVSGVLGPQYADRPFNNSPIDWLWSIINITFGIGGLVILARRRPDGAGAGMIAIGILTIGHLIHAIAPLATGDLDSRLRFVDLLAYPLLFTLPYRFNFNTLLQKTGTRPIQVQQVSVPAPAAELSHALLALLGTSPADPEACVRLAKAVALWLKADLCLVVTPPYKARVDVACAYDLIREQTLAGLSLEADSLPIVTAAMTKQRSLRLPASSTSEDVRTLAQALGIQRTGPILAAPLVADDADDEEAVVQGGLVLLSPYAQHSWTSDEQEQLALLGKQLGRWLAQGEPAAEPQEPPPPPPETVDNAQLETLAAENAALQARLEEHEALQEQVTAVAAAYEDAQRLVQHLETENRQLLASQAALEASLAAAQEAVKEAESPAPSNGSSSNGNGDKAKQTAALETLNQRLTESQREIKRLKARLRHAREEAESHEQNLRVLLSIAQDLRQPLASLSGYADLLLSESVGILGALQRQFVERIRANAARLGHAVDDIVRLLAIDANDVVLHVQQVHLDEIIDQAIARNTDLLRDKRLLLRVDLPETLPAVRLDKEMFFQIVHHLLRNAALASPEEGEIQLRVRLDAEEEDEPFLQMEISDSGGGIAAEDIPKVFSRRYRTAYRTIAGLGDNGLGMPLAKALVDALGGRIWIKNQDNKGAVFTVLLPLVVEQPQTVVG